MGRMTSHILWKIKFETTKQPIDVLGPITISGEVTVFLLVKFPDFPHLLQAPDPHQCTSTEHQGWHLTIRIAGILQKWEMHSKWRFNSRKSMGAYRKILFFMDLGSINSKKIKRGPLGHLKWRFVAGKIIERSGLCVPWSSEEELHGIKIYGLLAIGHRSHGGNPRILGTRLAILDRLPTPLDW